MKKFCKQASKQNAIIKINIKIFNNKNVTWWRYAQGSMGKNPFSSGQIKSIGAFVVVEVVVLVVVEAVVTASAVVSVGGSVVVLTSVVVEEVVEVAVDEAVHNILNYIPWYWKWFFFVYSQVLVDHRSRHSAGSCSHRISNRKSSHWSIAKDEQVRQNSKCSIENNPLD